MSKPVYRLGASSPGGLGLPAANPTDRQLYAPRGVHIDHEVVVVADSGNHRLLVWFDPADIDGQPADVVLFQPDFTSEGPNAAGRGPERGCHLPTGVTVMDGNLIAADSWNHRLLVFDGIPQTVDAAPAHAIGQPSLSSGEPNRGGGVSAAGMYWPYGVAAVDGWLWVTDTGNRRVLGWPHLPVGDEPAAVVLGQDGPDRGLENRGVGVGPDTFRWPHDIASIGGRLYVADAGDHRILGWDPAPISDRPADSVLGQPDFTSDREWPYGPQRADGLRFPYGITTDGTRLFVADTANNRVLVWDDPASAAADHVLGQPDFASNGENRWDAVSDDTFCWPYGIAVHGSRMAVADSGNNRVMVWDVG